MSAEIDQLKDELKQLVTRWNVATVADALGSVCRDHAEHLRDKLHDTRRAREWERVALDCEAVARRHFGRGGSESQLK